MVFRLDRLVGDSSFAQNLAVGDPVMNQINTETPNARQPVESCVWHSNLTTSKVALAEASGHGHSWDVGNRLPTSLSPALLHICSEDLSFKTVHGNIETLLSPPKTVIPTALHELADRVRAHCGALYSLQAATQVCQRDACPHERAPFQSHPSFFPLR